MKALAWYRLRRSLDRKWAGLLTTVLLVGLLGGLAMGSIAAARRTQAAFPTYFTTTRPSQLDVPVANWQPGSPNSAGSDRSVSNQLARLPHVKGVANVYSIDAQPLGPNGLPVPPPAAARTADISILDTEASPDGELTDQDRVTPLEGRLADPNRRNEIMVSSLVAQVLGLHIGQKIPVGFYTNAQANLPGYGTGAGSFTARPHLQMEMTVVAIVAFNNQVLTDSLGATGRAQIVFTRALGAQLASCCVTSTTAYLRLDHGVDGTSTVEREIERLAGKPVPLGIQFDPAVAEQAIKPESIALGVFGAIASLAVILIAGQVVGRQIRFDADDDRILRALGAKPMTLLGDMVLGPTVSIAFGSGLAVAVAIVLSPLAPIGVVRPVYPLRGLAFDWSVLGSGFGILLIVLSAVAVGVAYRQLPHRVARRSHGTVRGESGIVHVATQSGLPLAAVEGMRFALEPGGGTRAVPVRSAIIGSVLAVMVVIATITFGASLNSLVSHPQLYGWNWNYELTGGGGIAPVPGPQAARLLDHDRAVAAWAPIYFGDSAEVDGVSIPLIGQPPGANVAPALLSGHALDAPNQLVVGGSTLAVLHKQIGDTVSFTTPGSKTRHLQIVGSATMPIVGDQLGGVHPSMGTGALVAAALIPPSVSNPNHVVPTGPSAVLVRLRNGVAPSSSLTGLRRIADALTLPSNYGVTVLPVQRPAEIINYRSMGSTPIYLGLGLAAGATAALGLTLMASVRRRRRDLAIFKSLGFTQRQLAGTVAWNSTVTVAVGTVFGVPLGIIAGRTLWNAFAGGINAVSVPAVPAATIALVAVGAFVLAIIIAALPAVVAARTPTALLLRAE